MKVLHVIETLGHGGAEQLLVTLLPELKRQGVDVGVAVRRGSLALRNRLEAENVPVTVLPMTAKWALNASARAIAGVADEMQADVIHAHLYFPAVSTAIARARGMTKARTCVTFHNQAYAGANKKDLRLRGKNLIARYMYRRGLCGFFAVSEAVRDHYASALNLDNIQVVSNAINMDQLASVNTPAGTDSPLQVVVPGRLVPEKGHEDLLKALSTLPKDSTALHVTFVGDGPSRAALEQSVSDKGLCAQVSFTGTLDHPAFLSTVAGADIVVIPSRFEGFGLVALEAMALGRPVIASTAGGLPEVVGDAGLVIDTTNQQMLSTTLLQLLNDPSERDRLGAAGQARVAQKFSVQTMAAKLLENYHNLPSRPARSLPFGGPR